MRQLGLDLHREPPALDPRQRRGAGRRCDRAEREIIPRTYPGNCAISSRSGEFRKKITAVFADLVGSTGLAERLDPEVFRELVLTFLERMALVVEAHGGMVEHLAGDGVMGVFGAERAHGDDALRAVTAAGEMLSALDRLNDEVQARIGGRLEMRIGVNTGTIVVGRAVAGRAVSLGDPMNVAARLQAHAPKDQILIGAETHRLVSREVRTEPAGELELRGRTEPMRAYRVLGLDAGPAVESLAERPLVGRGRELGLLTVAFERAAARGSCEFVSVLGDAGVGKSRLVDELAARYERRVTLLVGRCLSYGEGITYWALADVIRAAAGIEEDDSTAERRAKLDAVLAADSEGEAIASHLAQLVGLEAADQPGEQSGWAVRRLLEIIAARGPVIVILDDLHWAETRLLDLVLELADGVEGPVLLVCMGRFELLEAREGWEVRCPTTISLRPLSADETDTMVERMIGDALPERFRGRLVELAAGNPLFVEQVLHKLIDDGQLTVNGDGWQAADPAAELAVPATIEALLAARVDSLSGPERRCAELAAVIGMEFWAAPLEELAGDGRAGALDLAPQAGDRAGPPVRRARRHAPLPPHAAPRRRLRVDSEGPPGGAPRARSRLARDLVL